jgi:hydrogenase maturation protease
MLIIGCGNRDRGDDAAGVLVAEGLRQLGVDVEIRRGEAAELIAAWSGADNVIVVDAVMTGAPPGSVTLWDRQHSPASPSSTASTHGLGLAEAIELARVLGCLPIKLRVYGIEGRRFEIGVEVSPEVKGAVERVVRNIGAEVKPRPLNIELSPDEPPGAIKTTR